MQPVVAVGIDGSPESTAAARWAAQEALLRGLPLHLVHVWVLLPMTAEAIPRENVQSERAQRVLEDVEEELRSLGPGLRITTDVVPGKDPSAVLSAAGDAEVLVLGSRGLGAVRGFFLGSTGLYAVAHSDRPVVLVRGPREERGGEGAAVPRPEEGHVAVGLSLRPGCDSVFAFAFDTAARHGALLRVVHAVGFPPGPPWDGAVPRIAEEGRRTLKAALEPWRERFPGVRVSEEVVLDNAGRAVPAAAEGAGLLVVGRRRHRPVLTPRIGPVAHSALHHASCPVAVVPHD